MTWCMYSAKNVAYILTSLEAIEKIKIYTQDISDAEDLFDRDDQLIYNACLTLLMTLGEEINKLNEELKEQYSDMPWQSIKGMRNRIAHDYRGLDPTIPYNTIKQYLDPLKECLVQMLDQVDYPDSKLNKILESRYYKHLQYLKK